jgi:GT2 family glycosyltransferase/peptidoglycan/xylan/chitin deacetylase (PgdA/CDA1 family)
VTPMLISIVVPTYNRADWLRGALESLRCQETAGQFAYEIIVVDNASTDATKAAVTELAANSPVPIKYVHEATPGDAPARNRGINEAAGEWLAFFDDDQFAQPDWLGQLYQAAVKTQAAIVGGAVHLDLSDGQLAEIGPVGRGALRELRPYKELHPYVDHMVPGCGNALVSRGVFDAIGKFDAARVTGGSDSDFFRRARSAGLTMWYSPHAVIRHRIPESRLTIDYFRWDALQCHENIAFCDYRHKGRARLALLCMARVGRAALVHLPLLLLARLRHDSADILGLRIRLWQTEAYTRRTLSLLAPRLFPQRKFFAGLEFRKGREVGAAENARSASPVRNARNLVHGAAGFLLRVTFAAWLVRRLICRGRATILVYHDPSPEVLRGHLRWLTRHYTLVPLSQLVEAMRRRDWSQIPHDPLAITIDDGHRGNYRLLDVIREFGVKPTLFLCSHIMGTQRHFWWKAGHGQPERLKRLAHSEMLESLREDVGFEPEKDYPDRQALSLDEVREMAPAVEFGSHTRFHPILVNCSDELCRAEIVESKKRLEELLGHTVEHFSYTNGDYTDRERRCVEQAGYLSARTLDTGWNGPHDDPLRLRAFSVEDDASINILCGQACGVFAVVRGLFRRLRGQK